MPVADEQISGCSPSSHPVLPARLSGSRDIIYVFL